MSLRKRRAWSPERQRQTDTMTTTETYRELTEKLGQAITESRRTDKIVRVECYDVAWAAAEVAAMTDDADSCEVEEGTDIWGVLDGEDYRLMLVEAPKPTKPDVAVQLPTEVSYWGTEATEADVARILDNLEGMIRSEFGGRADLTMERTATPRGSGIHCEDEELAEDIGKYMEDNWAAAL